jgi:hypothetical protein
MIIDHVNFKNFFINKTFNRKKARWWKKLTKLDLKIKYRFDKNNFADDLFRRRNYENETAKKNKNNENLNFKKWILIESKSTFKNKKKKKKNTYFFQLINHRHATLSNANSNSSEIFETIDETSKSNCFTRNNLEKNAKISIAKNAQNFLKKKKIVAIVKRILKKKETFQIIVSKYRKDLEKTSTRKRRKQRKSCFEKLNKKRLEQKNDVQRFVFEVSHRITYSATIWFACAANTIFCRKSIDETWQKERKRETFWFW